MSEGARGATLRGAFVLATAAFEVNATTIDLGFVGTVALQNSGVQLPRSEDHAGSPAVTPMH